MNKKSIDLNIECARIDFKSPSLPECGLAFNSFERVISVYNIANVIPAIEEIEAAANEGFYAVGYIAYEAAPAFDPSQLTCQPRTDFPLLLFGLTKSPEAQPEQFTGDYSFGSWTPDWNTDQYETAFNEVQQQITGGNTYQVNLTFPLHTSFNGSVKACYDQLHHAQSSNYSGFIKTDEFSIVSASPELFFEVRGNRILTRPMKGTMPRGTTLENDNEMRRKLAESVKDQAENLMIVDLLRNDIGRIAAHGSVREPEIFAIEKYPTVWQMTSAVNAELHEGTGLTDIFKAIFPCGSVTGAPKISTMKIINKLENAPRDVYCGAFGIIMPGGNAIFNVPIRTALITGDRATYHVGSGLVADSKADSEYEECLLKANILSREHVRFALLETMQWTPEAGFFLLKEHLERISDSAEYFDFVRDYETIKGKLEEEANSWNEPMRVRLLLGKNGKITIQAVPLPPDNPLKRIKLASTNIDSGNRFLYHKTNNRRIYELFHAEAAPDADDVLLYNQRHEITECTIANIAVQLKANGPWFTPPVSSGLLNGTMRRHLLECGELVERVITVAELKSANAIKLMNSVRGLFAVNLI